MGVACQPLLLRTKSLILDIKQSRIGLLSYISHFKTRSMAKTYDEDETKDEA